MEQQNRQIPPVQQKSYGKQLWHIWGPLLIKLVIAMLVSMAVSTIFLAFYIVKQYGITPEVMQNADKMNQLYVAILQNSTALAEGVRKEYLSYSSLVEGAAALFTIPIMLLLFHKDRVSEKMRGIIPNKKAPIWKYIAVVIMSTSMCLGMNNLILIGNLYNISEEYEAMVNAINSAPVLIQIISMGILVPICEELVFRGMLLKRLRERGTFLQAALYASVIYALFCNMDLIQMIYGFGMSMAFAYIYEKYGSVKAPILASMAANLLIVIGNNYQLYDWMMEDFMRIGIITILCAAAASTMFVLIQRIEEKPEIPGGIGET